MNLVSKHSWQRRDSQFLKVPQFPEKVTRYVHRRLAQAKSNRVRKFSPPSSRPTHPAALDIPLPPQPARSRPAFAKSMNPVRTPSETGLRLPFAHKPSGACSHRKAQSEIGYAGRMIRAPLSE